MLKTLADFLFARRCCVCGRRLLESEKIVCMTCRYGIPLTYSWNQIDNATYMKLRRIPKLKRASSVILFRRGSAYDRLLYMAKYMGRTDICRMLGEMAAETLQKGHIWEGIEIDRIIPVPTHFLRRLKKGYNQTELIAMAISGKTSIPVDKQMIKKTRYRKSQTHKTIQEKWENVRGTFHSQKRPYKTVLLIDDVMTTGSTLVACCQAIAESNPEMEICILTIAVVE